MVIGEEAIVEIEDGLAVREGWAISGKEDRVRCEESSPCFQVFLIRGADPICIGLGNSLLMDRRLRHGVSRRNQHAASGDHEYQTGSWFPLWNHNHLGTGAHNGFALQLRGHGGRRV